MKYGELNSSHSGHEPMVGTQEHGIECLGFTQDQGYLDELRGHQHLQDSHYVA